MGFSLCLSFGGQWIAGMMFLSSTFSMIVFFFFKKKQVIFVLSIMCGYVCVSMQDYISVVPEEGIRSPSTGLI